MRKKQMSYAYLMFSCFGNLLLSIFYIFKNYSGTNRCVLYWYQFIPTTPTYFRIKNIFKLWLFTGINFQFNKHKFYQINVDLFHTKIQKWYYLYVLSNKQFFFSTFILLFCIFYNIFCKSFIFFLSILHFYAQIRMHILFILAPTNNYY